MYKLHILSLFTILTSCLTPDKIVNFRDSQTLALDQLLALDNEWQNGYMINKKVTLDGESESHELSFDTIVVQNDLKRLRELTFSRLIQSTNYSKSKTSEGYSYVRNKDENNGPILILLSLDGKSLITKVEVNFEQNNFLYQSNEKVTMGFENSQLESYRVIGERKIIGLDPSTYEISVVISKP